MASASDAASAPTTSGTAYVSSAPSVNATVTRVSHPRSPKAAQSRRFTAAIDRPLAPNQRWRGSSAGRSRDAAWPSADATREGSARGGPSDRGALDAIGPVALELQAKPVEAVGAQAQEVRGLPDRRKGRFAEHLGRHGPGERGEVELDRLRGRREVDDDQER